MHKRRRVAITGMAITTPLSDTLGGYLEALLAGRSAITHWRSIDTGRIYCKVGADLGDYPIAERVAEQEGQIPDEVFARLNNLTRRAPWATGLSMLSAVRATHDAGWWNEEHDPFRLAGIVAGHNLTPNYVYKNTLEFQDEPDFIEGMLSLHSLDTDHVGSVSEVLPVRGPIYTVGGACASGNHAMRTAVDEIRYHGMDAALVVGAALDFSPMDLHAMALMGAITTESFNDDPPRASRPYDVRREGFVPAHGSAALFLEDWEHAQRRGARIWAEVLGVEASGDGNHLPQPSAEGQAHLMNRLLADCELAHEQIDYVNAHATSTPLGDLTEIRSIKAAFGKHANALKINAPKSMLGHTTWAAPVVETVAAVVQMNAGKLHRSINIEELDPEVDLDICHEASVDHEVRYCMKNAFGFGGINSISILRTPAPEEGGRQ